MNAGDQIAHYTVTAKLGAGGMGEVATEPLFALLRKMGLPVA